MPTSKYVDLISSALNTGTLTVTDNTIEFPVQTSKRFQKVIAQRFFPGESPSTLERFIKEDKFVITDKDFKEFEMDDIVEKLKRLEERERAQEERRKAEEEARKAEEALRRAWIQSGGAYSPVGLPLSPASQVKPGTWTLQCRSGHVSYVRDNDATSIIRTSKVTVRLVAIECVVKQETPSDQVYGVVSVDGPANRLLQSVKIPLDKDYLELGGVRLTFPNVAIVTDVPVEDLHIRVAWIENDHGDINDLSRDATEKLKAAANALIGPGVAGGEAEKIIEDNQDWILAEATKSIIRKLGLRDDVYPVESKFVPASELMAGSGPPLQPPFQRKGDSRVVDRWTHDIFVEGHDDGGDRGLYRFFFEVSRKDVFENLN